MRMTQNLDKPRSPSLGHQTSLPRAAPSSRCADFTHPGESGRLTALANLAAATYTPYADDLLFSGPEAFARCIRRFSFQVAAVAIDQGFAIQHQKTRIMRQSTRQQAAGIVINQRINVNRHDFDLLNATLTNDIRYGTQSQNRSAVANFHTHLVGRIAHVASLNSTRGRQLTTLFNQISWTPDSGTSSLPLS